MMAGFNAKTLILLSIMTTVLLLSWQVSAGSHDHHDEHDDDHDDHDDHGHDEGDTDILILGAGTAGLTAARQLLKEDNLHFIILEGSNETGGVLQSVDFGGSGLYVPSGQTFAYNSPDNSTLEVISTLGIELFRPDYESYVVLNDEGEDLTAEFDASYGQLVAAQENVQAIIEQVTLGQRSDPALKTALAAGGWVAFSPADKIVEWYEYTVEQGLPTRRQSTIGPYFQELGDEYVITNANKGLFPDVLGALNDDNLKLNAIVRNIDQSDPERVVVTLDDGTQYTAKYVLMTFSVGVLQQGGVTFTPALPQWKTEPIFNYQRGTLEQIWLKFSSKFWGDEEYLLHASDRPQDVDRHYYPLFMNHDLEGIYPGSAILSAVVTGDEALRVEGLTDEEIAEEVLDVLRSMYGDANVSELEYMYFRRWGSDPFHYGSFTSWPIPAYWPLDVAERLAAKVDRVYFAQQASSYFIGTSRGSIEASENAIRAMLGCIDEGACDDYVPVDEAFDGGNDDDAMDDDMLYGCVQILKKAGKTRKQDTDN